MKFHPEYISIWQIYPQCKYLLPLPFDRIHSKKRNCIPVGLGITLMMTPHELNFDFLYSRRDSGIFLVRFHRGLLRRRPGYLHGARTGRSYKGRGMYPKNLLRSTSWVYDNVFYQVVLGKCFTGSHILCTALNRWEAYSTFAITEYIMFHYCLHRGQIEAPISLPMASKDILLWPKLRLIWGRKSEGTENLCCTGFTRYSASTTVTSS